MTAVGVLNQNLGHTAWFLVENAGTGDRDYCKGT